MWLPCPGPWRPQEPWDLRAIQPQVCPGYPGYEVSLERSCPAPVCAQHCPGCGGARHSPCSRARGARSPACPGAKGLHQPHLAQFCTPTFASTNGTHLPDRPQPGVSGAPGQMGRKVSEPAGSFLNPSPPGAVRSKLLKSQPKPRVHCGGGRGCVRQTRWPELVPWPQPTAKGSGKRRHRCGGGEKARAVGEQCFSHRCFSH